MELWSFTIQDYSNFFNSSITIRDVDREKAIIQAFLNFHPVLATTRKPPEFIKSCLGGSLTTPLPQEPWIWNLDNLSLSRK